MMASGTAGNFYDDDNAVLDDDFLNDGSHVPAAADINLADLYKKSNQTSLVQPQIELP